MFDVRDINLLVTSRGVKGGSMANWNNRFGSPGSCSAMSFLSWWSDLIKIGRRGLA